MNHQGTIDLESERLILRKFKTNDAEDMYNNWCNDDQVTQHLTWPTHTSIEVSQTVLQSWLEAYEKLDTYIWAIELKATGELVGSISVAEMIEKDDQCSIGYCVGRRFWNQGITTEALQTIIPYLLHDVGFARIQAYHHTDNPASGAVMKKSGMVYEGRLRKFRKKTNGNMVDCDFYSITTDDELIY